MNYSTFFAVANGAYFFILIQFTVFNVFIKQALCYQDINT